MTLIVADDDPAVAMLVSVIFQKDGYTVLPAKSGEEVFSLVSGHKADIVLLDLKMPGIDGYAVCRHLRENQQTRHIPVIILSGVSETEAKVACMDMGADDYITKPFDARELRARVKRTLKRKTTDVSINPLTRLPGSPSIEEEAYKRLKHAAPFSFAYIDADNFKAFNDVYGYARGDTVIVKIAEILAKQTAAFPDAELFIGHVGGDDFVFMSGTQAAERISRAVAEEFDKTIPSFYDAGDTQRGYITTTDRKNLSRNFPIMTLSIALVNIESGTNVHYANIVETAAEVKQYAKGLENRKGSIFIKDRRMGNKL